jgi:glycosyltransferase involved in cell wall biosynthesis
MQQVSIVMRTYERPILLARAIASVQNQTFTDWNLVVVNNGGNRAVVDTVVEVARTSTPTGNITVLHLDDRFGMEEASNRGLAATQSEFFAIHDDDDSWDAEFLEVAVDGLRANTSAAAVVTGVTRIHETYKNGKVWPVKSEEFYLTQERLTYDGMIGNNTFPPIAAVFRRRLLTDVGGFDATLPVLGDWEFNLRAVLSGGFVFIPERLAHYHTRTPESESSSGNSITVGMDLHHKIREQLHARWLAEPEVNGVNKGKQAIAAYVADEPQKRRNVPALVKIVAKDPVRTYWAVSRRMRRIVRRGA